MTYRTVCLAGVIVGAAALAACSPTATAPPAADTAKDVAAITANSAQFNADYKARAADKLVAGDAPDFIGYFPFTAVQNGPEDAKAMAADFAKDPAQSVTITPDRIEVAKSGDLAYAVGHAEGSATNAKTHAVESRNSGYVVVFRKQSDGSWKTVAVSVSPGPPAAGPAPAPNP